MRRVGNALAFALLLLSSGIARPDNATSGAAPGQSQLPSGYAAPTAHGVLVGEGGSAPVAVGPCGTTNQLLGYPTISADPQCMSHRQVISWGISSTAGSGATSFTAPGITGCSGINCSAYLPVAGTLKNFYARIATAPGSGNSHTITVYTIASDYTSNGATAITCQIANTATTCNDTTHSASITAGQAFAVQIVSSASASGTGNGALGLEFDNP